jgi:hypothetical protein
LRTSSTSAGGNNFVGHKLAFDESKSGDICGIAFDIFGNIVILNRGNHRWSGSTFDWYYI